MSDYDPRGAEEGTPDWPAIAGGSLPNVPARSSVELCGRIAGPVANMAANQNFERVDDQPRSGAVLFDQLPAVIRDAVDEWAVKLTAQPWGFSREIMGHFPRVFADQVGGSEERSVGE